MAEARVQILADTYDHGVRNGLHAALTIVKLFPTEVTDREALSPEQRRAVADACRQIADIIKALGDRRLPGGFDG
jgi:hypothetical protein